MSVLGGEPEFHRVQANTWAVKRQDVPGLGPWMMFIVLETVRSEFKSMLTNTRSSLLVRENKRAPFI